MTWKRLDPLLAKTAIAGPRGSPRRGPMRLSPGGVPARRLHCRTFLGYWRLVQSVAALKQIVEGAEQDFESVCGDRGGPPRDTASAVALRARGNARFVRHTFSDLGH